MAEWQPLNREYGITYYGCSRCAYMTANRFRKCPKCQRDMLNGERTPELERLYNKVMWARYWTEEKKKGIQMTKGGLADGKTD